MRLELSRFIEGDLDNIASYIAQDNPRRAVTFIQDVGNYAILFPVIGEVVRIERVAYGGRDLPTVFDPS